MSGIISSISPRIVAAIQANKFNTSLNAFRGAVNGGYSAMRMVDGVADEFNDSLGIGSYTGFTLLGGAYHNAATSQLYGTTTGGSGTVAARAFVVRGYQIPTGTSVPSVEVYLTTAMNIQLALVRQDDTTTYTPVELSDFSHPGTGWASFDVGWDVPESGVYFMGVSILSSYTGAFTNNAYTAETVNGVYFTGIGVAQTMTNYNGGSLHPACRINGFGAGQAGTLINVPYAADGYPVKAFVVALVEHVDAQTAGIDWTLNVSRDGGGSWVPVTLGEVGLFDADARIYQGEANINLEPEGYNMAWKLQAGANRLAVHGVSLQWM